MSGFKLKVIRFIVSGSVIFAFLFVGVTILLNLDSILNTDRIIRSIMKPEQCVPKMRS